MIEEIIGVKSGKTETGGFMALDTFGKRLRVLRIDRDLSQIDLRDRMEKEHGEKIGETYISELERTDKMPSLKVAAAMARVLNTSLDYLGLLSEDGALSYQRTPPPEYFSPEADEVARLVDDLQPAERAVLLSVARGMVKPSAKQLDRAEARDVLNSIGQQLGEGVKRKVEDIMRQKGLALDADT